MDQDDAFMTAVLSAPQEDPVRLVYADWLEERGDPRGELLRVAVRLEKLFKEWVPEENHRAKLQKVREIARLKARFRHLLEMVPLEWLTRIHRGPIQSCSIPGWVNCPKRWELLQNSNNPTIRRCSQCSRDVWYCRSVSERNRAIQSNHLVVTALVMDRVSDKEKQEI